MMIWFLSFFIILIFVIGAFFWNQTVLSSTAQQATLNTQAIVDRYCSQTFDQSSASCQEGLALAQSRAGEIVESSKASLIATDPDDVRMDSGVTGARIVLPSQNRQGNAQLPDGGALGAGWGYSYVRIRSETDLLPALLNTSFASPWDGSMQSSSVTFSYDRPPTPQGFMP